VTDKSSLAPAKELTAWIVNVMKERGVLLSVDGPLHNVIKIKPPMVIAKEDCDFLAWNLDEVLSVCSQM
jgi:4-aminobutyrate aminotransferase-like enzyme